MKLQLSALGWD